MEAKKVPYSGNRPSFGQPGLPDDERALEDLQFSTKRPGGHHDPEVPMPEVEPVPDDDIKPS